jgi:hypothetical protein
VADARHVFLVTWGQLYRHDWEAVLVKAHDADEARVIAGDAYPERYRPQNIVLASPAVTRAVLAGDRPPGVMLRVLE